MCPLQSVNRAYRKNIPVTPAGNGKVTVSDSDKNDDGIDGTTVDQIWSLTFRVVYYLDWTPVVIIPRLKEQGTVRSRY